MARASGNRMRPGVTHLDRNLFRSAVSELRFVPLRVRKGNTNPRKGEEH
ncbi:unnamed protein product [Nezara viridula]|uniref:Uncharacterized protein n=1 Tax=Nezara viridula TaxID=85310 RepID=A0A9P0GVA7_NEZVI|nr:unnamed protein product [Nezara viridula]